MDFNYLRLGLQKAGLENFLLTMAGLGESPLSWWIAAIKALGLEGSLKLNLSNLYRILFLEH